MKVKKLQQGGMVDPGMQDPSGAGVGPEEQIVAMAGEIINQLGPEAAMLLAEAIVQMVQGGAAPQEAPAFVKKGGKLVPKK